MAFSLTSRDPSRGLPTGLQQGPPAGVPYIQGSAGWFVMALKAASKEQPLLALPADALGTGQRVDGKFLQHIKALQHQSASSEG